MTTFIEIWKGQVLPRFFPSLVVGVVVAGLCYIMHDWENVDTDLGNLL